MDKEFLASLPPEELAELHELRRTSPRRGGSPPPKHVSGYVSCEVCRATVERGSRGKPPRFCSRDCARKHLISIGICGKCETRALKPGCNCCPQCLTRAANGVLIRRAERIANGICTDCGTRPVGPPSGYERNGRAPRTCLPCRRAATLRSAIRRNA